MAQTFNEQIDNEMAEWFTELQNRKKETPLRSSPVITSEVIHLNGEQARKFLANPQEFRLYETSRNSNGIGP